MATSTPVNMDTLITVKVQIQGSNRKFKLPLRELVPTQFPQKLQTLLSIPGGQGLVLERFSDSAAAYVTLDPDNVQVYKTLMRAAKAKLKLRIRATVTSDASEEPTVPATPHEEASVPAPEPPKPRPASLAAPFGQLSHRPVHSVPARETWHPLTPSSAEPSKTVQVQLPGKSTDVDGEGEAPVPKPFPARENFFAELASISRDRDLALRMKEPPSLSPLYSWSVYCNNCDKPMANEHYHCSICDDGDYDLCSSCVDAGNHCPGESHWLIKRFVHNGKVINSTTEKIAPKPKAEPEAILSPKPTLQTFEIEPEIPGAFTEEKRITQEVVEPTRTCNACVKVFREREFVTCADCEDYDLCLSCHLDEKHGHHPGHTFQPATTETNLNSIAETLCKAGRNVRHNAICDGCDKFIYGVRHKCLNCPDWDYCTKCIESAKFIHPVHRFVPIYDPLPEPRSKAVRHYGIYCDGPLCQDKDNQTYIEGVRYKCAVCHDTDFCAACEAIPINRHNRTHPLIKFKTPVRNVSVTTMGEDRNGVAMATMGDQFQKSVSTETLPVSSANAATQVQTIADLKPTEGASARSAKQLGIKDLLSEPIKEKITVQDLLANPPPEKSKPKDRDTSVAEAGSSQGISSTDLNAHFIRDTIIDGTKMPSGEVFVQSWTVRNPGPHAWPAGCSVRYVGGDNMLNIDDTHPSSAANLNEATGTNTVNRRVEVNEDISFTVTLKAPKKEGTAISYWRLKAADGTPFGHRLWCHIEVTPPNRTAPHDVPDLATKLMLLERFNQARLEAAQKQMEKASREASLRVALAEAEKRHAKVRAETLENMRRTAALIDGDLQKLTSDAANLSLGEASQSKPSAVTPAEESKSKSPTQPTVESAPPSPAVASTMIFPKLEKESPVSSTHESHRAEASASKANTEVLMSPSVKSADNDIFEDAESVEFFDESDSDDDGFVTDEEYDILDASDEEAA